METHTNPLQLSSVARILSTPHRASLRNIRLRFAPSSQPADFGSVDARSAARGALRSFVQQMPPLLMLTCTFARSRRQRLSERSANAGVSRSSYGVVTMSNPKTEPTDNTQKNPDEWVSGDDPMTGAQASYLKTLCEQAGNLNCSSTI